MVAFRHLAQRFGGAADHLLLHPHPQVFPEQVGALAKGPLDAVPADHPDQRWRQRAAAQAPGAVQRRRPLVASGTVIVRPPHRHLPHQPLQEAGTGLLHQAHRAAALRTPRPLAGLRRHPQPRQPTQQRPTQPPEYLLRLRFNRAHVRLLPPLQVLRHRLRQHRRQFGHQGRRLLCPTHRLLCTIHQYPPRARHSTHLVCVPLLRVPAFLLLSSRLHIFQVRPAASP